MVIISNPEIGGERGGGIWGAGGPGGAQTEEVGEDMVGSTAGRCQIWGRDVRKDNL